MSDLFDRSSPILGRSVGSTEITVSNAPLPTPTILARLERDFPKELALLHAIGIHHRIGPQLFYDPFLQTDRTEDFSNVGAHCALVAYATRTFTERAMKQGLITWQDGQDIVRKALLHDAFKPWDAFYARARRTGILPHSNPGIDKISSEQIISGLQHRGFSLEQAGELVSELDHDLDPREICQKILIVADNGYLSLAPGHFREKIIWLADCMTCSIGSAEDPLDYYLAPLERFILSGSFEKYSHSAQKNWRYTTDKRWLEESSPEFASSTPLFEGNVYDISLILTGLTALELFGESIAEPSTANALLAAKRLLLEPFGNQPLSH